MTASVPRRLEERERAARKRVEELQAELEAAQSEWVEWLIARRRVGEVWAGDEEALYCWMPWKGTATPLRLSLEWRVEPR